VGGSEIGWELSNPLYSPHPIFRLSSGPRRNVFRNPGIDQGIDEVSLAYAITIHKSQGSEFPIVVIPLAMQHYMLLQRNLIYTGITRGIGTKVTTKRAAHFRAGEQRCVDGLSDYGCSREPWN
jgi:hypothetical protein